MTANVEIRLLGPVDATIRAAPRRTRGPEAARRPRGALALAPRGLATTDSLIDAIWDESPPASVRSSLQVHVSAVRRTFAEAGRVGIITAPRNCYALEITDRSVDVVRFSTDVAAARRAAADGDLVRAGNLAAGAVALVHGDVLGGVGATRFAAGFHARIDADRLEMVELVADWRLASGDARASIRELEIVAEQNPYRESMWQRLALALYRVGRQRDALERLASLRAALARRPRAAPLSGSRCARALDPVS